MKLWPEGFTAPYYIDGRIKIGDTIRCPNVDSFKREFLFTIMNQEQLDLFISIRDRQREDEPDVV